MAKVLPALTGCLPGIMAGCPHLRKTFQPVRYPRFLFGYLIVKDQKVLPGKNRKNNLFSKNIGKDTRIQCLWMQPSQA